jgi:hypothetical protein
MWFGDRVRGRTQSEVFESSYDNARHAVVDVLRTVKCYDMMRESGKVRRGMRVRGMRLRRRWGHRARAAAAQVVVFENKIPFQLAFYALIEHGKGKPAQRNQALLNL